MAYDLIIVGAGNGACGFLSKYLRSPTTCSHRVLVLEEGASFFDVSDIGHENNWSKSFSEANIFKLHNAFTPNNIPIITGRACAMGGGGSINYTMIHESSEWLAEHIGETVDYWDALKHEMNALFQRPNPVQTQSAMTSHVLSVAEKCGYTKSNDATDNIPNLSTEETPLLHQFPTQFNAFGQRTHSGVAIVDWSSPNLELRTRHRVTALSWASREGNLVRCDGVEVENLGTGEKHAFAVKEKTGRILMCAGAATPMLLMEHGHKNGNGEIGKDVNDHILIPLGIYLVDDNIPVTGKDIYIPVFATEEWRREGNQPGVPTVGCFDFYSGELDRVLYFVSHLFLAFLPNWIKRVLVRYPLTFYYVKRSINLFLQIIFTFVNFYYAFTNRVKGVSPKSKLNIVTSSLKFVPRSTGRYISSSGKFELEWFSSGDAGFNQDMQIAIDQISKNMKMLNALGSKPPWVVRMLLWLLIRMPYSSAQVPTYVKKYSKSFLLSQQHVSGGCLFGKVLERGTVDAPERTGRVCGSENVFVADLSAVGLPRISPQMTAYLVGYHIANKWGIA